MDSISIMYNLPASKKEYTSGNTDDQGLLTKWERVCPEWALLSLLALVKRAKSKPEISYKRSVSLLSIIIVDISKGRNKL